METMSYEEFVKKVSEDILGYLPEEFKGCEVQINKVVKSNMELDGLCILTEDNGLKTSPTLYLQHFYADLAKGAATYPIIIRTIANRYLMAREALQVNFDVSQINRENAEKYLYCTVLNAEKNKALAESVPHRVWNDLIIVCHWMVLKDGKDFGMLRITHDIASNTLQMTDDEVIDTALRNTRRLFPTKITPMTEIILSIIEESGIPHDLAKEMIKEISKEMGASEDMYKIGNEQGPFGAVNIVYDEVLSDMSNIIRGSFYILPSSVHEAIAVKAISDDGKKSDPDVLKAMVRSVNQMDVDPIDFLSDSVYYYDWLTETLTKVE